MSWWWLLLATGMVVCCLLSTGSPLLVPGCRMSCTIVDVAADSADDQRTTSARIVVVAVDRFAT